MRHSVTSVMWKTWEQKAIEMYKAHPLFPLEFCFLSLLFCSFCFVAFYPFVCLNLHFLAPILASALCSSSSLPGSPGSEQESTCIWVAMLGAVPCKQERSVPSEPRNHPNFRGKMINIKVNRLGSSCVCLRFASSVFQSGMRAISVFILHCDWTATLLLYLVFLPFSSWESLGMKKHR